MDLTAMADTKIAKYEFSVPIRCPVEQLWSILADEIDAWWPSDFRALGEGSTLSLSLAPSGALLETDKNGGYLEWFRVQMVSPSDTLYLVGYLAPDWGGPTVSMLKLAFAQSDEGSILTVSDALMGNVTQKSANSALVGWKQVFGGGLKTYAETQ